MKNKTALIVALVALLVVIVGGVLLVRFLNQKPPQTQISEEEIENLPPVDPSVIVDVKPKPDGKSVILSVSNIPANTDSIEYELTYTTGEGLLKGSSGKVSPKGSTELTRDILFGTCSTGGKCTYDTGMKSVKLVLRFNSAEGSTQFSQEYSL